jgi:Tol biopolymer transport system component/imidazolonepropionase-like amidohydrolase
MPYQCVSVCLAVIPHPSRATHLPFSRSPQYFGVAPEIRLVTRRKDRFMTFPRFCFLAPLLSVITTAQATPVAAQSASPPAWETLSIRVHEGTTLSLDLSPDGRSIVFDLLGQLWEMPAGGGVARALTDAVRDTAEDLDPSYAPDGRRIVFRGERRGRTGLWLLEPQGSPIQLTQLSNPDGFDGKASWSPDGTTLAFTQFQPPDSARPRWQTALVWLDVASRSVRAFTPPPNVGANLRDPDWSPDGKHVAVVAAALPNPRGGRLWMVDLASRQATPITREGTRGLAPAIAPDGRRAAFLARDSIDRVQVWVTTLGSADAVPLRLTGHDDVTATRVRWTPDGRSLVYSADGRIWRVPADGGAPVEIPFTVELTIRRPQRSLPPARFPEPGRLQPVRNFMGMALSPDAGSIALLALGKLWVMPVGSEARAIASVPLSAHHLAWSPDGRTLAWSGGAPGEADVFATDLASGVTRQVTRLSGREEYPAYSPDGRRLAFFHLPSEDSTVLRVIDAGAREVADPANGWSMAAESGAEAYWSPSPDALLYVTGGFSGSQPTAAELVPLSGERRAVKRMPDSPLFLQWAGNSIVYVRHARLWRASFDSTGMTGTETSLGPEPALYVSVARDGTVLFVSDSGLRMRSPDGRHRNLGWPLSYTPPVAPPVLIRNVRIIDGTGRPATAASDVLVEQGRISRIVAAGTPPSGSARVVDAGGRFLVPGFMDLHAHEYRPAVLPGFPYFGVTTVRDQGSAMGPLIGHADGIAAGLMEGPRVGYGGFQFYSDWAYDTEDGQGVEPEADADHLVRAVEMARAFGSQHIKTRTFRRWDINARFITEAHRRGMWVTGHCAHQLPLVAAGMDAKEHAGFCGSDDGFIYDDQVQLFRAAGIGVVPTITYASFAVAMKLDPEKLKHDAELAPFLPAMSDFGWMLNLDSTRRRMFERFAAGARHATAKLARAGVTMGTGTDIWQIPTGVHMEMEELVAAGLTPLQAIQAATGGAAKILGAEQDLGTIEPGKWADLVILDADPVADIRNTRRIWAVFQAGRQLDREAIVRSATTTGGLR